MATAPQTLAAVMTPPPGMADTLSCRPGGMQPAGRRDTLDARRRLSAGNTGEKPGEKPPAVTAGASPKPLFTASSGSSEPVCRPAISLVSVPGLISARRSLTV